MIREYLVAQLKRNHDTTNYFVDGNDFLDTGLVSYTNYTNDKQAFSIFFSNQTSSWSLIA